MIPVLDHAWSTDPGERSAALRATWGLALDERQHRRVWEILASPVSHSNFTSPMVRDMLVDWVLSILDGDHELDRERIRVTLEDDRAWEVFAISVDGVRLGEVRIGRKELTWHGI